MPFFPLIALVSKMLAIAPTQRVCFTTITKIYSHSHANTHEIAAAPPPIPLYIPEATLTIGSTPVCPAATSAQTETRESSKSAGTVTETEAGKISTSTVSASTTGRMLSTTATRTVSAISATSAALAKATSTAAAAKRLSICTAWVAGVAVIVGIPWLL
jgi:hypothetical protein